MSIVISWPDQTAKALTSIEIYRKVGFDATIDPINPGTPYKTLEPTATSFTEDLADLTEKTIYCYWIAAVKDNNRMLGARIVQGFYLDTGPGNTDLIQGDWSCGYFGPVSPDDFFNFNEVTSQLTAAQRSVYTLAPTTWHKFIYRGRILFYPENGQAYATLNSVYGAGMMFGTDDAGVGPKPNNSGDVVQSARVKKDGREYRIRMPWATVPGTAGAVNYAGEFWCTMARLFGGAGGNSADSVNGAYWSDKPAQSGASTYQDIGAVPLIPMTNVSNTPYAVPYRPTLNSTGSAASVNGYVRFVFELILP